MVGAIYWLTMARVVRGQVISLRTEPFVEAARAMGVSQTRIISRHIFPNLVGIVIVYLTLTIPRVMLFEAFLVVPGAGRRAARRFVGPVGERGHQGDHAGEDLLVADRVSELGAGHHALCAEFSRRRLRDALDPKMIGR